MSEPKTGQKWDLRFQRLAVEARSWVKGSDVGVGACIVSPDGRLFSLGYSGYPKGLDDSPERLHSTSCKDEFMVHAELNAILNAGRSVEGWTLYTTKAPCSSCCSAMMQAGIKRVVSPPPETASRWHSNQVKGLGALKETNIEWSTWIGNV